MKTLAVIALLCASSLYAQVQIGKNVQIGSGNSGATGTQYRIAAYTGSGDPESAVLGQSNATTDATGNTLTVPTSVLAQSVNTTFNVAAYNSGGAGAIQAAVNGACTVNPLGTVQITPNVTDSSTTWTNACPSTVANITAVSVSSGMATFTANNTFAAGDSVVLSLAGTGASAMDNYLVPISATGLSSTQFEAPVTALDMAITSVAGTASKTNYVPVVDQRNAGQGRLVFNVENYGASRAVTDNRAAIQAAIDACDAQGQKSGNYGVVEFPSSQYELGSYVTYVGYNGTLPNPPVTAALIRKACKWVGVGNNYRRNYLQYNGATPINTVVLVGGTEVNGNSSTSGGIEGMTIDANGSAERALMFSSFVDKQFTLYHDSFKNATKYNVDVAYGWVNLPMLDDRFDGTAGYFLRMAPYYGQYQSECSIIQYTFATAATNPDGSHPQPKGIVLWDGTQGSPDIGTCTFLDGRTELNVTGNGVVPGGAFHEFYMNATINTIVPTTGNIGTGYTVGDMLTVVQGGASDGVVRVVSVDGSGGITGLRPYNTSATTGYSVGTGLTLTGGSGSGGEADITAIYNQVPVSINMIDSTVQNQIVANSFYLTKFSNSGTSNSSGTLIYLNNLKYQSITGFTTGTGWNNITTPIFGGSTGTISGAWGGLSGFSSVRGGIHTQGVLDNDFQYTTQRSSSGCSFPSMGITSIGSYLLGPCTADLFPNYDTGFRRRIAKKFQFHNSTSDEDVEIEHQIYLGSAVLPINDATTGTLLPSAIPISQQSCGLLTLGAGTTSDAISCSWVTSNSECFASGTNSAAGTLGMNGQWFTTVAGTATLHHPASIGTETYAISCSVK